MSDDTPIEPNYTSYSFKESWWRVIQYLPKAKLAEYIMGQCAFIFDGIVPTDPKSMEYRGYFDVRNTPSRKKSASKGGIAKAKPLAKPLANTLAKGVAKSTRDKERERIPIDESEIVSDAHAKDVLSLAQLTDYAASHFAAPKPTPEFLADFHRRMCESGWYDKVGRAMSAGMVYRELSAWWQRERDGVNASNQGANNLARASTAPALEDYPLPS